jgi:osmotically inducible protein OsmC
MSDLKPPPVSLLEKYTGSDFVPIYRTSVVVTGGEARHGRASGIARSNDGALELNLRLPRELGGSGGGTNPEQLLAAGFAACFHGALNLIAAKKKLPVGESEVSVNVTFGRDPVDGRYSLIADVEVRLPGLPEPVAEELIQETEKICPYAKMMRQGARSSVKLVSGTST